MRDARPSYLSFHISDECDARCLHCDIWRRRGSSRMPAEAIPKVVRSLSRWLGPVEIQVSGGEPLTAQNTPVLLEACARLFLPLTLTTNGLRLDEEWAERLTGWRVRHVNFSLDGFSELHDRMRGVAGSFRRVMEGADRLSGRGVVKPRVTCVIMKDNLDQLVRFARFVCRRGFEGLFFQAMAQPFGQTPERRWWRDNPHWPTDRDLLGHVLGELSALKKKGLPILNPDEQFEAMRAYFADPGQFTLRSCTVGDNGLTVGPDGSVRLCPFEEEVGNVLEDDIERIWFSAKARRCREKMRSCGTNCHLLINCCFDETQARGRIKGGGR